MIGRGWTVLPFLILLLDGIIPTGPAAATTRLVVRITDETGRAAPGLRIVARPSGSAEASRSARTDDAGVTTMVLPKGLWTLRILDSPPVRSAALNATPVGLPISLHAEGGESALTVVVATAGTVAGRVVREDGTGLVGVVIHLTHGGTERRRVAQTDRAGAFRVVAWEFPVTVTPDTDDRDWEFDPASIDATSDAQSMIFVARERTDGAQVRVLDPARDPLRGVRLTIAYYDGGALVRQVSRRTSDSGEVSIPCDLGDSARLEIRLDPGSELLPLDWRGDPPSCGETLEMLMRRGATLTGEVRSEVRPLADVPIRLGNRTTRSDAKGVFRFRALRPGIHWLYTDPGEVLVDAETTDCASAARVIVADPPTDVFARFSLVRSSIVCVTPRATAGIPSASHPLLELFRGACETPDPLQWSRSEHGALCTELLPGAIKIRARDEDGWLQTRWWREGRTRAEAKFIGIGEGDRVDLTLDLPRAGRLELDTASWPGTPSIHWRHVDEPESAGWRDLEALGATLSSDRKGVILVGGVAPGAYRLKAFSDDHEFTLTCDVSAGTSVRLAVPYVDSATQRERAQRIR